MMMGEGWVDSYIAQALEWKVIINMVGLLRCNTVLD